MCIHVFTKPCAWPTHCECQIAETEASYRLVVRVHVLSVVLDATSRLLRVALLDRDAANVFLQHDMSNDLSEVSFRALTQRKKQTD